MGFELEPEEDGVKTEIAETAQVMGSTKAEAIVQEFPSKKGRGRPKGSKAKSADDDTQSAQPKKGAKRGKSRGDIACMGCKQMFCPDTMSTGGNFCLSCRRALDRLYKIAAWEGEKALQFLKETRGNAAAVQSLLKHYLAKTGQPAPGKREKATYSLLTYQESVETATGIEKRNRGRYVWRRQFLAFAQSVDGGLKSEEDAVAEWSRMCLNVFLNEKTMKSFTDLYEVQMGKAPQQTAPFLGIQQLKSREEMRALLERYSTVKSTP